MGEVLFSSTNHKESESETEVVFYNKKNVKTHPDFTLLNIPIFGIVLLSQLGK